MKEEFLNELIENCHKGLLHKSLEKKTTEETQAKIHEKASGTPAGTFGSIFAVTSGRISVRTLGDIHVLIM